MLNVTMPALPGTKPNVVAGVFAKAGDTVEAGQELFSVETSKRTVPIAAPASGTISRVLVVEGDVVSAGDVLAEIEERSSGTQGPDSVDAADVGGADGPAVVAGHDGAAAAGPAAAAGLASPTSPADEANNDTSQNHHAELLIIGGGTGGYVTAIYAAKMGKQVTLVERAELGGTCLNRGCIPTKSLIASASLYRDILHASEWGLAVEGSVRPDMNAIIARKDRIVRELADGIKYLMAKNRIRVLRGTARFEGNGTVVVNGEDEQRLSYDDCIIATGSAIRALDLPGADLPEVLDTDRALDCTTLPSSIIVVGGGVTGVEFAFMYANLGVDVTILARRNRLLHLFDEDASIAIASSASARGIHVELGANVKGFAKQPDGTVLTTFERQGEIRHATSDLVLLAGGRVPATQSVGIETTDITLDEKTGAVIVDANMRTKVDHVYAIGDVNGLVMLAHAAAYQGRIAVDDILGKGDGYRQDVIPSVAYTDPEVATIGVSVDEARRDGARFTIGTFSFAHNGKALTENSPDGYVSLVCDTEGLIRGATIVGGHASALISPIGLAISAGLSGDDVRRTVFAHPTTAEAIHEAACDLTFGALHE